MNISLKNLGTVNKNAVFLETENGRLTIYFSYETPVSFEWYNDQCNDFQRVTRVNDWSNTTGKLLNECEPDHKARVTGEEFEKQLELALTAL